MSPRLRFFLLMIPWYLVFAELWLTGTKESLDRDALRMFGQTFDEIWSELKLDTWAKANR